MRDRRPCGRQGAGAPAAVVATAAGTLEVAQDDTALGSRAVQRAQVDPAFGRDPARERRGLDSLTLPLAPAEARPPLGRDGAAGRDDGGAGAGRSRSFGWSGLFRLGAAVTAVSAPPHLSRPAAPIRATSCETGTVVPAGTTCLSSVPPARATSSITALSVSTSASTSPTATASPSFFFHSTRRPSSIVGESASMTTLVAMLWVPCCGR